jgi:DNA-binding transcriptional LysR family regulator
MNLSGVDLNLLLVLSVVLEEQSVTRAARRLHVTAPAVSNSLARLRGLLGDPLVVRSGRGLVPTPRGHELLPRLRGVMAELSSIVEPGERFDPASATRTFSVACSDVEQVGFIPVLAARFAQRLPRCQLAVTSIDRLQALGGPERAEVDVVIAPQDAASPALFSALLYEDEAALVARRRHPRLRGPLTRARFNTLRHVDIRIALGERGIGNRAAEELLSSQGLVRDIAVTVPTFMSAIMLAAATDLVAGVPRRLACALQQSLPIAVHALPGRPLRFRMCAFWQRRTHDDAGSKYFRDLLLEAARQ